jgi:hypothetical protein
MKDDSSLSWYESIFHTMKDEAVFVFHTMKAGSWELGLSPYSCSIYLRVISIFFSCTISSLGGWSSIIISSLIFNANLFFFGRVVFHMMKASVTNSLAKDAFPAKYITILWVGG